MNEKCALALLKLTKTDRRITFLIMSALLRKTLSGCLPKILITQIGHKIDFLQILYVNCTLPGYFEKHFWALNAFFDSVQGGPLVDKNGHFRGSTIGLVGCRIWLIFVAIFGMGAEKTSGMGEVRLRAGAGFYVFKESGCENCKGKVAGCRRYLNFYETG